VLAAAEPRYGERMTTRRDILLGAGSAALALAAGAAGATPQEAAAAVEKFTGGKPATTGKISIDLPEIAENGNTVPLAITVESPMTAADHVSEILVVAEANPLPRLATFHLGPMAGRAAVATRIRLAATENVIVVAKTSKGELLMERRPVKVTIGGCGG
jgi:sulfur-oxidizing protein SoxY